MLTFNPKNYTPVYKGSYTEKKCINNYMNLAKSPFYPIFTFV